MTNDASVVNWGSNTENCLKPFANGLNTGRRHAGNYAISHA
jgi:hypothetical protein